ncbi:MULTISPECIES: M1 family metallopeptidase [unclassified Roseibium]|uniref:M1 family metallopeptidase n=1 Tax=unclassified Roseibium TaxID=2629323 RepID=UPI00273F0287|nr:MULTISPECIES: M1 family aminopeptidase [unclassified Roseibium]
MIRPLQIALAVFLCVTGTVVAKDRANLPHYDITADLDPETGAMAVEVKITGVDGGPLALRRADWLTIENVTVGGSAHAFTPQQRGFIVPLSDVGPDELVISARGTIPALASGGRRSGTGSAVSGANGTFLSGYSGWFPWDGSAPFSYRLNVSVPAGTKAVSPGAILQQTETAENYTVVFASEKAFEAPSLFAGPYEIGERDVGGIRVRTYFPKRITGFSDDYLDAAGSYLTRFSAEIGPYPYEDFHIISSPLPVGLAFVNLTYIGEMIVPLPFMKGRSLAHEVLHNWWGNGVYVDYPSGNWSEGLTTFMADYGLAKDQGSEAAKTMRLQWLRDYAALPESRDERVRDFIGKEHQAAQIIGYNKAAFQFHMLEMEIGQESFEKGLQQFWSDYRYEMAGWSDMKSVFETVSDKDLTAFFDQWLDRVGAPELKLAEVQTEQTGDDYLTRVTVRQSTPAYSLLVPVELETPSKTIRELKRLDGQEAILEFRTGEPVKSVHVDPDFDLFRRLLPGETMPIMRDITLAPSVTILSLYDDDGLTDQALALANGLMDRGSTAKIVAEAPDLTQAGSRPLIVVGEPTELAEFAEDNAIAPVPDNVAVGALTAWAARSPVGAPVLLIASDDAETLRSARRSLRHYGRQSYVVMGGGQAPQRGIWPVASSPLMKLLTK